MTGSRLAAVTLTFVAPASSGWTLLRRERRLEMPAFQALDAHHVVVIDRLGDCSKGAHAR